MVDEEIHIIDPDMDRLEELLRLKEAIPELLGLPLSDGDCFAIIVLCMSDMHPIGKALDVYDSRYSLVGLKERIKRIDHRTALNGVTFEEDLLEGISEFGYKFSIKMNNHRWRIHKNDPDPFPSSPHAHNLERGIKVHLGTGDLCQKKRFINERMPLKNLIRLREAALQHGFEELPPLTYKVK